MTKRLFIFVALAVLVTGVPAMASVTTSYTTSTPVTSALTDWSPVKTLAFQKFNPTWGALNSVTIVLSGSLSTVVTVTNNSQSSSSGQAYTHMQITVQDSGSNLINTPQIDLTSSPAFNYTLNGGQSTSSGTLTRSGMSSDTYTLAAVLNEFKGTGTTLLNAGTFTQTFLANTGGNTDASQVTYGSLTGTVTYDYTVPEPATITLLCMGAFTLLKRKSGK
jgi:hypothetical protein